jgi:hypothetical protein
MVTTNDICTMTNIPKNSLINLFRKFESIIVDDVYQTQLKGDDISMIDLQIGTLYIQIDNDEIHYRFKPSDKLDSSIRETLKTGNSPVVTELGRCIQQSIFNVYKELL